MAQDQSGSAAGTGLRPWQRWSLWGLGAVVLLLTFLAYLNPHMALDLANRLWACF